MEPLGDLKAKTGMDFSVSPIKEEPNVDNDVEENMEVLTDQRASEWKMDSLGPEQTLGNQSNDAEKDLWRSHSASVNNDRESKSYSNESEKDCKTFTVCLNPSSPSQDVPPEFEKVFVKVEDVSASDEEHDEQKFWIEEPCVGQEPQAGCSSWSDQVDHQRGRDLDSTTVKGKGGSHQHKDLTEDRSGACGSPVTNDPEAAIYCVGSEKDFQTLIPCSNTNTSIDALTIEGGYACGFEQKEYLSIPVEVIDKGTKTSTVKQVHKGMPVATRSAQSITQNSSKNRLTIENYVCEICNFETPTLKIFKDHMLKKHSDQKPFHCKLCDYKCSRSSSLKVHERNHTSEKPYNCKFCDYKCSSSHSLKLHETNHTGENIFHCKFCDRKYSNSFKLKVHERTHTGEKPYSCKFCDYKCSISSSLKVHETKHSSEKAFHCELCDYKCARLSRLKEHVKTHTGEKAYHCEFCDYKCYQSYSLKLHVRKHTGEKPFHCKFCDFKCSTSAWLKVHVRRSHTGEKPYSCKFCDFKCSYSAALKVHERIHTGESPYNCKFCDYKCSKPSNLSRHERTHTGEKPYNCQFCDFKCSELFGIKVHERIHTGEKPYSCKFCDFKCSYSAALRVHERIHTGENPYSCKFCNYKCSYLSRLKVHERIHTGEKPYNCEICDYKCSQLATLKRHKKTHTLEST